MTELTGNAAALLTVTFLLGLRHGLDADHIAAVDGLSRASHERNPRLARWCGTWFSLGHGLVVTLIATAIGLLSAQWQIPGWVDGFGAMVSIAVLCALGALNLHGILHADPGEMVRPIGLRGRWIARLLSVRSPLGVLLLGALFALSFDTLTLTTTFAVAAGGLGSAWLAALLGIAFTSGMALTDGVNGFWVARLMEQADRRARVVSRAVGLAVVKITFLVAFVALAGLLFPAAAAWLDAHGLWLALAIPLLLLASYRLAEHLVDTPLGKP